MNYRRTTFRFLHLKEPYHAFLLEIFALLQRIFISSGIRITAVYNLAYSGKSEPVRDFFSTSGCNLLGLPDELLRCSSK